MFLVIILVKSVQIILSLMRIANLPGPVSPIQVVEGLGNVKNSDGTFNILNKRSVQFLLSPPPCSSSQWMLVMVSSRPTNTELRAAWRRRQAGSLSQGVKVVFLVAQTEGEAQQTSLEAEHAQHGDIVQVGVPDGHRLLGYKILAGHVWAYQHCHTVRQVAKSDDNVELDMEGLVTSLEARQGEGLEDVITCPTVSYNPVVIRSSSGGMTGAWSESKDDWERDSLPTFCVGFLSVSTPRLGAQLAQVGLELYRDRVADVLQIEDSLITGVLRERLPHITIEVLSRGHPAWNRVTSWCSFTHMFKQTFFNDLVISKVSSRSNIHYVGSVTNIQLWKFYLCVLMEASLQTLQSHTPLPVPDFLWTVCTR